MNPLGITDPRDYDDYQVPGVDPATYTPTAVVTLGVTSSTLGEIASALVNLCFGVLRSIVNVLGITPALPLIDLARDVINSVINMIL